MYRWQLERRSYQIASFIHVYNMVRDMRLIYEIIKGMLWKIFGVIIFRGTKQYFFFFFAQAVRADVTLVEANQ